MQVLAIAAFYALVIRQPDTEEEERDETELRGGETWQHQHVSENDPQLERRLLKPPPAQQLELDEDYVKEARIERWVRQVTARLKMLKICVTLS